MECTGMLILSSPALPPNSIFHERLPLKFVTFSGQYLTTSWVDRGTVRENHAPHTELNNHYSARIWTFQSRAQHINILLQLLPCPKTPLQLSRDPEPGKNVFVNGLSLIGFPFTRTDILQAPASRTVKETLMAFPSLHLSPPYSRDDTMKLLLCIISTRM